MNAAPLTLDTHTEELFARYLEGTLSELEAQDFHNHIVASPTLQTEVSKMQEFDAFLDESNLAERDEERVDAVFLVDMQRKFAQIAIAGSIVATKFADSANNTSPSQQHAKPSDDPEGALARLNSEPSQQQTALQNVTQANTASLSHSATHVATNTTTQASVLSGVAGVFTKAFAVKVVAGAVFVSGTAFGVWKYISEPANDALSTAQQAQNQLQPQVGISPTTPAPTAKPQVTLPSTPANTTPQRTETIEQPTKATTPAQNQNGQSTEQQPDAKSNASIDQDVDKTTQLIAQQRQELQTAEQQGDKVNAAYIEKKLGILLRERHQFAESTTALERALKAAQGLKLRELEGEIHGERGKLFAKQGAADKATEALRKAVEILSDVNERKAEGWKRELERLEKK